MMGVPINGPAQFFGDNMIVFNSASIPECNISKKHLGIFYQYIQEASEAGIRWVGFVKGKYKGFNCLTNVMSGTAKEK